MCVHTPHARTHTWPFVGCCCCCCLVLVAVGNVSWSSNKFGKQTRFGLCFIVVAGCGSCCCCCCVACAIVLLLSLVYLMYVNDNRRRCCGCCCFCGFSFFVCLIQILMRTLWFLDAFYAFTRPNWPEKCVKKRETNYTLHAFRLSNYHLLATGNINSGNISNLATVRYGFFSFQVQIGFPPVAH